MSAPLVTTQPPILISAAQPIIQALLDAGLRVFDDPKDLNPPCVYYGPPTLRFSFRAGDYECDQTLLLCSGHTAKHIQYQELSELMATVQTALGGRVVTARPADVWTADQTAVLAAYELTWTDLIRQSKGTRR